MVHQLLTLGAYQRTFVVENSVDNYANHLYKFKNGDGHSIVP